MICQKCNKNFPENEIEVSHDIPEYIGGTDSDGRHNLCKKHHKKYDLLILNKCLKFVNEIPIKEHDEVKRIIWMKELQKPPEKLKIEFRKIAKKVREEFFNG